MSVEAGSDDLGFGAVRVPFPVILAPMAGVTDWATRSVCRDFGAGMTFTEVVNASGLVHNSRRTYDLLHTAPDERPVVAHLYGSDPAIMGEAAAHLEALERFDAIDINCGCPVRRIVARGAGAALMKDPKRVEAIVTAVGRSTALPVTVKTRSGLTPESVNVMDVLRAAEAGGAAAFCLHARPASQHHRGAADWGLIAEVKEAAAIPVIGNGGVDAPGDALRMKQQTGVDGIMIGRAAIGAPWIFAQVRDTWEGRPPREIDLATRRRVIATHLERMVRLKHRHAGRKRPAKYTDEEAAVLMFRVHLAHYLRGFKDWLDIRRGLNELRSVEQVMNAVDRVIERQSPLR